jgi:hypothetical protein
MPSGSGPVAVAVSAVAVGQTETLIATLPASSWNNPSGLGNLVQLVGGIFNAPTTGGTLTLRIRQGGLTGTLVQSSPPLTVAANAILAAPISGLDQSAYAAAQQNGTYALTAVYAAAAGGTLDGQLSLQTCAPVA